MPNIGGKKFPYTAAGMKDAAMAKKKAGKKAGTALVAARNQKRATDARAKAQAKRSERAAGARAKSRAMAARKKRG
jgi:hypothetical protein